VSQCTYASAYKRLASLALAHLALKHTDLKERFGNAHIFGSERSENLKRIMLYTAKADSHEIA
jgi:hypothetical protein